VAVETILSVGVGVLNKLLYISNNEITWEMPSMFDNTNVETQIFL